MIWTKEQILEKLETRDRWVEKAIVAIYNRQTESEKRCEDTNEHNKVGFSSFHAKRGTYYAKWILSGKRLSGVHVEKARKLIKHYVRQLVELANR